MSDTEEIDRNLQQLSQLAHVKKRPGMFIGSTNLQTSEVYVLSEDYTKIVKERLEFTPALIKIFDETISNSVDHHINYPRLVKNIKVNFSEDGEISVYNDGPGIPVTMFETLNDGKMYIPQVAFSQFLTSDNYDDSKGRVVAGMNGYGAKLTNAFSRKFTIETMDKKTHKHYTQVFEDGMDVIHEPTIVTKASLEPFTKVTFLPDFKRLGYDSQKLDKEHMDTFCKIVKTRTYETAAFIGKAASVYFNDELIEFPGEGSVFERFVGLFLEDEPIFHTTLKHSPKDSERNKQLDLEVCIAPSNGKFSGYSLINNLSVPTGNHIKYFQKIIVDNIKPFVEKKMKAMKSKLSSSVAISNNLAIFVKGFVVNPEFDSQTKSNLVGPDAKYFNVYEFKESEYKKIWDNVQDSILDSALDKLVDKKKSKVTRTKIILSKGEDAKYAGNKAKASKCTLFIAEGDSALGFVRMGISHKKTSLEPDFCGSYSIQGVPPNARKEVTIRETKKGKHIIRSKKLQENKRFEELVAVLGLDYQKTYETDEEFSSLRYGRVVVATDQDVDGTGQIFGQILNFFTLFWPKLIERGFISRLNTPVLRLFPKSGKGEIKEFYTLPGFDKWVDENFEGDMEKASKKYKVKYYKGLATHDKVDIQPSFKDFEKKLYVYEPDDNTDKSLEIYFGKETFERKVALSEPVPENIRIQEGINNIPVTQFLSTDVKEFQRDNILRKLPSLLDGLVPSRRKAFFAARLNKKMAHEEIKVASFAGDVISNAKYLHGDASLCETIIKMSQTFVGARNIPLFKGIGNFGSRQLSGDDAGSSRYLNIMLNKKLTDLLFPPIDDFLLEYSFDEGRQFEPQAYIPIIPMAVLENQNLPATGWKIKMFARDINDVFNNVRKMVKGEYKRCRKMKIWLRGNNSDVRCGRDGKEYLVGKYKREIDRITITELPLTVYNNHYIKSVCYAKDGKSLLPEFKDVNDYSNYDEETNIDEIKIVFDMQPGILEDIKRKYENKLSKGSPKKNDSKDDDEESYEVDNTFDFIEDFFKLRLRIDTHLNMIDKNNKVRELDYYGTIVNLWFEERKKLYGDRIDRLRIISQYMIHYLENIIRFAGENNDYKITRKTTEEEFNKILKKHKYNRFNKSLLFSPKFQKSSELDKIMDSDDEDCNYDYIINLTYKSLLANSIKEREKELAKEKENLEAILNDSQEGENTFKGQKTWLRELDLLEKVIKDGVTSGWR